MYSLDHLYELVILHLIADFVFYFDVGSFIVVGDLNQRVREEECDVDISCCFLVLILLVLSTFSFNALNIVFDSLVVLEILVKTFYQILLFRGLFNVQLDFELTILSLAQTQLNTFFAKFKKILLDPFALYPKAKIH